jgi:hypothetical protein
VAVITFLIIYFETGDEYTSTKHSFDSLYNIVFLFIDPRLRVLYF